jgi:release factor glutamine methyltransferase
VTTVAAALADAARRLAAAGIDEPRADARLLLEAAAGLGRAAQLARRDEPLAPDAAARLEALLARRLAREPVFRILGEREFRGLPFRLSPDTLEPRPDTETVVEAALDSAADDGRPRRVLDLGTGTGCILLSVLHARPAWSGVGVDVSAGAAATARANADRLGLAARAAFAVADWGDGVAGPFDLVVSNPPYIPAGDVAGLEPEVREHDPRRALAGGPDGLDAYREIAARLPRLLAPGGAVVLEIGIGQAGAVGAILDGAGLAVEDVRPDLGGVPRAMTARSAEKRVGSAGARR